MHIDELAIVCGPLRRVADSTSTLLSLLHAQLRAGQGVAGHGSNLWLDSKRVGEGGHTLCSCIFARIQYA